MNRAPCSKGADVSERLRNARWVLRIQMVVKDKALGDCLVTLDSPQDTKALLWEAYKQARQMVRGGKATYAGAFDRWGQSPKVYSTPGVLIREEGKQA